MLWDYKRDGIVVAVISSANHLESFVYVLAGIVLIFLGPTLYRIVYPATYSESDRKKGIFHFSLKLLGLFLMLGHIPNLLANVSRLRLIMSSMHGGAFSHLSHEISQDIVSSLAFMFVGAYLLIRGAGLLRFLPPTAPLVPTGAEDGGATESEKTANVVEGIAVSPWILAFTAGVVCMFSAFISIYFAPQEWSGFLPVWLVFYAVLLAAAGLVLFADVPGRTKATAVLLFVLYVIALVAWTFAFYTGMISPELSLLLTAVQLILLLALIKKFWGIKRIAVFLLIPAMAWQAFGAHSGYSRLKGLSRFRLQNIRVYSCVYSFGGYSAKAKRTIPGIDTMKGYGRMDVLGNFNFTYSEAELEALKEAMFDPCEAVRDAAFTRIGAWDNSRSVDLLLEIFESIPAMRTKVLWKLIGYPTNQYARSNQKVKDLVLKTAGAGSEENLRYGALLCISPLGYAEGQEYLLAAMSDPSPRIREVAAQSVIDIVGWDDSGVPQRLREIYAASSDTAVKDRIARAFRDNLSRKYPNIPLELDKTSGSVMPVDTQKVPLQALSYPIEGSSTTVLFNIPAGSKTKGYIEANFGRDLTEVTPELKRQMESEFQFYTVKGDSYLVGIGGGKWIKGILTDFRAISPACGGFVVGVLSVDSPEEQKLLRGASGRELFVMKDIGGSLKPGFAGDSIGMLRERQLTQRERKSVEIALRSYIVARYGEWKTRDYEDGTSRADFDELRKLANYEVELKYKLVPVKMGKGGEGFIVTAGWGRQDDCYAAVFGYLRKTTSGYELIKIAERRVSPDATGERQREQFQDYALVGTVANIVDYNNDGYGDIIYSVSGYESHGYVLREFDGTEFRETSIGYGLGC